MQDCVTRVIRKRKKKNGTTFVIFASLLFLLIFFISAILVVSKRSNVCFESRKLYAVYVDKNKNLNLLADMQSRVKSLGGAGVFFQKNNDYYLIASIYNDKGDAKEVLENLRKEFESADVLEIDCKSISKKIQNELKQNNEYFELFNFLYEFLLNCEKMCFEYNKGVLSEGGFMSKLLAEKLELQTMINQASRVDCEDLRVLIDYSNLIVVHFENLFDKFYSSDKKCSLSYEFYVNLCLTYVDLCNNLQ